MIWPSLLTLCLLVSAFAPGVHAQDQQNKQDKHRQPTAAKHPARLAHPNKHKAEKPAPAASDSTKTAHTDSAPATKPAHEENAPGSKGAPLAPADAEENVHKEGGTEVKTLEFGGLDIEGQLKTPQMLYFLNRLRAEFDRPQLPHRSFMPELQRTTREDVF